MTIPDADPRAADPSVLAPGGANAPATGTETPVPDRLASLDLLRGFALCGILLMNVTTFAWPEGAYTNIAFPYYALDSIGPVDDPDEEAKAIAKEEKDLPWLERERRRRERQRAPKPAYPRGTVRLCGVSGHADLWEFVVADLLFDNKMRTLFSMLFGAGIVLLAGARRDHGPRPAWMHYRRMAWLLVIGALHGYLLWTGDILFAYACVGLWLYPLRNLPVPRLVVIGTGLFLLPLVLVWSGPRIADWIDQRGRAVEARVDEALAAGPSAPDDAEEAAGGDAAPDAGRPGWIDRAFLSGHRGLERVRRRQVRPELATLEIRKHLEQGYAAGVVERFRDLIGPQAGMLLLGFLGFGWPMVIGMALLKSGFLAGDWSVREYGRWAAALFAAGIAATWCALVLALRGASFATQLQLVLPLELAGSFALALAHASALLWAWKSGRLGPLAVPLMAAGRMALSNYLCQTLICTGVFAGFGLGLHGKIPRAGLAALVAGIWLVQLSWSPWWLARFRFGPVEWIWRSLAAWERLPMRRSPRTCPP